MNNQIITKDTCINRDFIAYAEIDRRRDRFGFAYYVLYVVVPGIYNDSESGCSYETFYLYKNRSSAEVEKALKEYYEGRDNWEDIGSVEPTETETKFNKIINKQGYVEIYYRSSSIYSRVEATVVKKSRIYYSYFETNDGKTFKFSDYGNTWALTEEELTR